MNLDLINNMVFEYDEKDYPDFADAYVLTADYDGIPMDENQLDSLNEEHSEFVHEQLLAYLN